MSLNDVLSEERPELKLMSEMTKLQLSELLKNLNTDEAKIHIFKFIHDLYMIFGKEKCGFNDISE